MTKNERENLAVMIRAQLGVLAAALDGSRTADHMQEAIDIAEKAQEKFVNNEGETTYESY